MSRVAIVTDSNSGITQSQGKELGISVIPMPFYINGKSYLEDINLTQEQFYEKLTEGAEISTSMPSAGDVLELWSSLLKEYDEIVHIPMSSGLSGSCQTAMMLAEDFDGKVQVVDNQRISVTQKQSVLDAITMVERGMDAVQIKEYLLKTKFDSTIYITLATLKYLKKGGRITPAAAALGTLLRIKPVLQIQGEKLDAFAKARTLKQAKTIMIEAIQSDCKNRFHAAEDAHDVWIHMAYTGTREEIDIFKAEVQSVWPEHQITVDPLSLSVSCHIGPGAIAITATKKMK
ncbi:MAG: DegV family protein [Lachnospiraceae bacterium]|nr:DegV family protein [Lachnospiraceae bacterium]